jgi:hypothetical protein
MQEKMKNVKGLWLGGGGGEEGQMVASSTVR